MKCTVIILRIQVRTLVRSTLGYILLRSKSYLNQTKQHVALERIVCVYKNYVMLFLIFVSKPAFRLLFHLLKCCMIYSQLRVCSNVKRANNTLTYDSYHAIPFKLQRQTRYLISGMHDMCIVSITFGF